MGYRIDYGAVTKMQKMERKALGSLALSGIVFALFLLAVELFWPEGKRAFHGLLFSGDPAVTAMALENLSQELRYGTGLSEALGNFCREILKYAH